MQRARFSPHSAVMTVWTLARADVAPKPAIAATTNARAAAVLCMFEGVEEPQLAPLRVQVLKHSTLRVLQVLLLYSKGFLAIAVSIAPIDLPAVMALTWHGTIFEDEWCTLQQRGATDATHDNTSDCNLAGPCAHCAEAMNRS